MIYLWEYDWPGNIRELENLIERLVLLSDNGVTDLKDLPPNIRSYVSDKKCPQPTLGSGQIDLRDATEQLQHRWMEEALRLSNGNKSAAAELLSISRPRLYETHDTGRETPTKTEIPRRTLHASFRAGTAFIGVPGSFRRR